MKKIFTSRKCLWLLASVALLTVSCFKLTSVSLSTHELHPNETLTVTSTLVNAHFDNIAAMDAFGLYGVRVPEDWSVEAVSAVNNYGEESVAIEGTGSDFYAALLQHCYPREGYKWVAYQTDKISYTLNQFSDEATADNVTVTATLKAGSNIGDYTIDVVVGSCTKSALEELYSINEDNSYDFSEALNETGDNGEKKNKAIDNLLETGTLSDLERYVQKEELAKINEYPDIANVITEQDLNVRVTQTTGIAEISSDGFAVVGDKGGIRVVSEGAVVDNAVVTVYDAEGRTVDSKAVVNGETLLKAAKGVNLVEVLRGGSKTVKKIFVK